MDEALKLLVDKLAHKRFFMVLTLQYVCLKMSVPEGLWWVPLVCASVVTAFAVACYTYLAWKGVINGKSDKEKQEGAG